jgi:hypothetical protein
MAVTRWKSNFYVPGTIVAGYYGDVSGTAYALMQGIGTAYKLTAGTAQLATGSVNVTTSLSIITYAVAGAINGTAGMDALLDAGTVRCNCAYSNAAGTLAIIASDGVAVSGTAQCAWIAIGY